MVNEKKTGLSTKAYILDKLRNGGNSFISGETLGKGLGISRVAVWKAVKALGEAGYLIEKNERGYRFTGSGGEDFLYPWEFGEREGSFLHWNITDSTMNRARELAAGACPGGTVITAETQSAGRGRNGRPWVSKPGGLFFTILERPNMAAADYVQLTLAVHIALGRGIARMCGKEARLRWPNDVYVGEKKIAGLLTELFGEGDRIRWITLGIGVNINNNPATSGAANIAQFRGHPVSRRETLLTILCEIKKSYEFLTSPGEQQRRWNRDADGIGRRVLVLDAEGGKTRAPGKERVITEGVFCGIDFSGRSMIKTGGDYKNFPPGRVSLRFEPFSGLE
ncbi:MAG: biotin--[acetyl-CoA-carboxylase] ligase [Treponema sp.]|jgi:BirA family biotin operon repressor/biotin-[acetyl-CoA-carboxylase] ligase|nr:biotin--[acetyl-CoA-carboxylase] ligase [Treponema sp.]